MPCYAPAVLCAPRVVVSFFALATGLGCDTALGTGPDGGGTPDAPASCLAANNYSDLPSIEENIFKRQCSFGPCHDDRGPPAEKLVLLPGKSHAELVNVASIQQPDILLVEPGRPDRSYLMIKMGEYDQALRKKTIMPQGSVAGMCFEKRDAIRRWIESGAPGMPPDAARVDARQLDASPFDAAPDPDAGPGPTPPDAP